MAYHSDWPGGPRDPGRTPSGGTCGAVLPCSECLPSRLAIRARPSSGVVRPHSRLTPTPAAPGRRPRRGPLGSKSDRPRNRIASTGPPPTNPCPYLYHFELLVKRGRKADKTSTTLSGGSLGSRASMKSAASCDELV